MSIKQPFSPHYGANQVITAAAASATVVIDPLRTSKQLRIMNGGTGLVYVRVFDSRNGHADATTSDFPVDAGMSSTITKQQEYDSISYISADGTVINVIPGNGW